MTLVKYTKKVDLTVELLEDEDSHIMAFLDDFVGRGMAKTHNSLRLTEVAASGTSLKTFASASVIAVDEPEAVVFNDDMEPYLDDTRSCAWVMRRSVHGEIALLDDSSTRRYANNQLGNEAGPSLLGSPIVYSYKAGATQASAKSAFSLRDEQGGRELLAKYQAERIEFAEAEYGVDVDTLDEYAKLT